METENQPPKKKNIVFYLILLAGLSLLVGASYLLVKKILIDRRRALSYTPYSQAQHVTRTVNNGKETRTYTKEELEEARKKGQTPVGAKQPYLPSAATTAADAAVQRSLRTLEEINRINEMNRRLQEQQQRRK